MGRGGSVIGAVLAILIRWWRFRRYVNSETLELRPLGDEAASFRLDDRMEARRLGFVGAGTWRIVVDGRHVRRYRVALLERPPDGTVLAVSTLATSLQTELSSGQRLVTADRLGLEQPDEISQCVPRARLAELERVHRDGLQRLAAAGATWREPDGGAVGLRQRDEVDNRDRARTVGFVGYEAARLSERRRRRATLAEGTARTSPGRSVD